MKNNVFIAYHPAGYFYVQPVEKAAEVEHAYLDHFVKQGATLKNKLGTDTFVAFLSSKELKMIVKALETQKPQELPINEELYDKIPEKIRPKRKNN